MKVEILKEFFLKVFKQLVSGFWTVCFKAERNLLQIHPFTCCVTYSKQL